MEAPNIEGKGKNGMRVIYWLLSVLGAAVFSLGGIVVEHSLSAVDSMNSRLAIIEQQQAARSQSLEDLRSRMDKIEAKLDQISDRIRKI
jgi:prefoldin subunit 5